MLIVWYGNRSMGLNGMIDIFDIFNEFDIVVEFIVFGCKLFDVVEYDVNGKNGKGGNGGLVFNEMIKVNGNFVCFLNKIGVL